MSLRLRDILLGLRDLELGDAPVVVHAALSAFGEVEGGAETVAHALATVFPVLLAPAFTYKTMITPPLGPPNNGITYGAEKDQNRMAEFFSRRMPVDALIGAIPEALRRLPNARRSMHPILSFTGLNAEHLLATQTLDEPFAPLIEMEKAGGIVLLLGVNHTVNTSIHAAERLAGRMTFTRWALTSKGILACPNFPGCSAGFEALAPELEHYTRRGRIDACQVQAVPMKMLFRTVIATLKKDPLALLCQAQDCGRCNQVRQVVWTGGKV